MVRKSRHTPIARAPRAEIHEMLRDSDDAFCCTMTDGRIRVGSKKHGRTVTSGLPLFRQVAALCKHMTADEFRTAVYSLLS